MPIEHEMNKLREQQKVTHDKEENSKKLKKDNLCHDYAYDDIVTQKFIDEMLNDKKIAENLVLKNNCFFSLPIGCFKLTAIPISAAPEFQFKYKRFRFYGSDWLDEKLPDMFCPGGHKSYNFEVHPHIIDKINELSTKMIRISALLSEVNVKLLTARPSVYDDRPWPIIQVGVIPSIHIQHMVERDGTPYNKMDFNGYAFMGVAAILGSSIIIPILFLIIRHFTGVNLFGFGMIPLLVILTTVLSVRSWRDKLCEATFDKADRNYNYTLDDY